MKLTRLETSIVKVPPPGYGGSYWFFDELLVEPLVWEEGYYTVPKSPGIGADLKPGVLEKYKE